MKKEDIDKKIGMPDIDAEWAKFEHDVIDAEVKSHKRVMLWGLSIAASIALVIGLFLFAQDAEEQAETMVAVAEKPVAPNTHASDVITPATEEAPAPMKEEGRRRKDEGGMTKKAPKTELRPEDGQLAMITPSDTKKGEATGNHPATEESVKVFSSVEQSPGYPGGYSALQAFLKANKRYDGLAREYGANGRVITTFLVDSLGYISDVKVHRCLLKYDTLRLNRETLEMQQQVKAQIATQLSEESKRLVSLMPRWMPGKMYGKSRNVRYTMPIQFP